MTNQPMHRIARGDSRQLLRGIGDGTSQLVLADPPFGTTIAASASKPTILNNERPFIWWLDEAYRICAEGGALVCFHRWDVAEVFRMAIETAGFKVRSQLVWDKGGTGMGDLKAQFGPGHELAWFATKGRFAFPDRRPSSVLRFNVPRGPTRSHPCEKPVAMMEHLIKATTKPGDLVVDPFCGTGASIVACVRTGRRGRGFELDGRYARKARERVARERTLVSKSGGPDLCP